MVLSTHVLVAEMMNCTSMWSRVGSIEKEFKSFQPNHFLPVYLKQPVLSNAVVSSEKLKQSRPIKMMKLDGKGAGMHTYKLNCNILL